MQSANSPLQGKIIELLDRLDEEVRNAGITSAERALNYAATQQLEMLRLVKDDLQGDFEVDTILPPRQSSHCRAGSDCWDVEVSFFNPGNIHMAPILVRQSVDVSDVIPVHVDKTKRFRRR